MVKNVVTSLKAGVKYQLHPVHGAEVSVDVGAENLKALTQPSLQSPMNAVVKGIRRLFWALRPLYPVIFIDEASKRAALEVAASL